MNVLEDIMAEEFQLVVAKYINRNKNILDIITKYQTATARLNRAVVKSATQCGCISIEGKKSGEQPIIAGTLCADCKEVIENEIGDSLFYIAGICNALDMSIYDIILKEKNQLNLLGNFSLK